jgi:hypothetical protein
LLSQSIKDIMINLLNLIIIYNVIRIRDI